MQDKVNQVRVPGNAASSGSSAFREINNAEEFPAHGVSKGWVSIIYVAGDIG